MAQRILVLEDDPNVCSTIKSTLEQRGYVVDYYYHADEAWRSLHRHKPDLLLLDTRLPDVQGWEFADRIRKDSRLAKIPIVVLAKTVGFLDRLGAKMHRTAGFLEKPFQRAELEAAVKAALAEQ